MALVIYSDGGCIGNPGPGGWAAVLVRDGAVEEIGGAEGRTTNNRMEMRAALEGLRKARPGEKVRVVTDSRYLHDGISKWIHAWKRRGWRKADGGEVLNRDLWEGIDALVRSRRIRVAWERIPGHSGHPFNERCDQIANAFARGQQPDLRRGDGSWITGAQAGEAPAPGLRYPVYLSLVDGELRWHLQWADCESWVKGVKGARYKKIRNGAELETVLRDWGVDRAEAARQLGLE